MYKLKKDSFFHPGHLPIVVSRISGQGSGNLHSHEFPELVITVAGQGLHVTQKESWPIASGDVFVIRVDEPHEYQNTKDLSIVNVLYDLEHLDMRMIDLATLPGYHALFTLEPTYRQAHRFESKLHLSSDNMAKVEKLLNELEDELGRQAPGHQLMTMALFMQLIGYLSRCYGRTTEPTSKQLLRVGQAISYIEQHYQENLNLARMSHSANMSTRNFQRVFQKAMGTSPVHYLIRIRISHAAQFLRYRQDMNITEVAYRVGFHDSNYFSRQFRKVTGITPREFASSERP